jgi:hypothetical protein
VVATSLNLNKPPCVLESVPNQILGVLKIGRSLFFQEPVHKNAACGCDDPVRVINPIDHATQCAHLVVGSSLLYEETT